MQKRIVKLTKNDGSQILIGVDSIIDVKREIIKHYGQPDVEMTIIRSREAMVTTNYVTESVEEIYNLINS